MNTQTCEKWTHKHGRNGHTNMREMDTQNWEKWTHKHMASKLIVGSSAVRKSAEWLNINFFNLLFPIFSLFSTSPLHTLHTLLPLLPLSISSSTYPQSSSHFALPCTLVFFPFFVSRFLLVITVYSFYLFSNLPFSLYTSLLSPVLHYIPSFLAFPLAASLTLYIK